MRLDLSAIWIFAFDDDTVMIPNAEILKSAVANSNSGELTEMVVMTLDLPWDAPLHAVKALATEAARSSPYCNLKKPVGVTVAQCHEQGAFVVTVTIKASVVDVRLERLMASDIIERILDACSTPATQPEISAAQPA